MSYEKPRDAFATVLAEDKKYPDEKQELVGLYVTGATNPLEKDKFGVDATNVAHYSDMIDTANKAIAFVKSRAESLPTFQVFQMPLVDISFYLGVQIDRWLPLELYKWLVTEYIRILNVPPRIP